MDEIIDEMIAAQYENRSINIDFIQRQLAQRQLTQKIDSEEEIVEREDEIPIAENQNTLFQQRERDRTQQEENVSDTKEKDKMTDTHYYQ